MGDRTLYEAIIPMRTPETMHFSETNCDIVNIDKFTIEQLRAATMNRKEAEETRLDMLREAYEKALEDEARYSGLYNFGKDDDS